MQKSRRNISSTCISLGSPRIGNQAWASFASKEMARKYRLVHYRDTIPHVPLQDDYFHIDGEWYEENDGEILECHGAKDMRCSSKWSLLSTNTDDHYTYLNIRISCPISKIPLHQVGLTLQPM